MVFAWILAHKFLTLLALISAAFCVSTIVLGVSNAQLKSEIEELKENTSPSTSSSTNPSITSSSGSTSTSTSASIPTTTTPPATDAMSKYRLPSAIKPSLYHLYLYPRLDTGLFSGRVVVTMSVDQTAPSVVVHSNKLDVSSVTVAGRAANFEVDEFYEIVTITKGDGTSFTSSDTSLEIDFSGDMKNRIVGLYTSSYTNSDGGST